MMGKYPARHSWSGKLLPLQTLAFVALFAVPLDAFAHSKTHHALKIQHPWTLEGQAGNAIVHMTIQNTGSKPDRLVSVSCENPCHAVLQGSSDATAGVPLPPESQTKFLSTGLVLILEGIQKPLTAYDRMPLTLTFDVAGPVVIEVMVEPEQD